MLLCGEITEVLFFYLQVVTKLANVHPKDPDAQPGGVDDMTKLAYLHEPGVLYNLASRYDLNDIYVSHFLRLKSSCVDQALIFLGLCYMCYLECSF